MEGIQAIMARATNMGLTSSQWTEEEREKYKAEDWNRTPGHLHEKDGYDCPICLNRGDICKAVQNVKGNWYPHFAICKCMEVRRNIRRMKESGLKDIIRDYTFEKFTAADPWQKTIKDAAEAYAKDPKGWFFAGGQSGAGKTHICTAICRKFLLGGKEVKYMLWRDDIVQIKQLVNDYEKYMALIEPYKNAEVLYIDDLFKTGKDKDGKIQKPTPGDVNAAFEILNFRYNDPKKLTIISSECTMDGILEIDEALAGRIFERAKVFNLGPDRSKNYRLRGAVDL